MTKIIVAIVLLVIVLLLSLSYTRSEGYVNSTSSPSSSPTPSGPPVAYCDGAWKACWTQDSLNYFNPGHINSDVQKEYNSVLNNQKYGDSLDLKPLLVYSYDDLPSNFVVNDIPVDMTQNAAGFCTHFGGSTGTLCTRKEDAVKMARGLFPSHDIVSISKLPEVPGWRVNDRVVAPSTPNPSEVIGFCNNATKNCYTNDYALYLGAEVQDKQNMQAGNYTISFPLQNADDIQNYVGAKWRTLSPS